MFHAAIRSQRDVLHFFGEVSSYNLQTLQFYLRDTPAEGFGVRVELEVSSDDYPVFKQHARRLLQRLDDRGGGLDLRVVP